MQVSARQSAYYPLTSGFSWAALANRLRGFFAQQQQSKLIAGNLQCVEDIDKRLGIDIGYDPHIVFIAPATLVFYRLTEQCDGRK